MSNSEWEVTWATDDTPPVPGSWQRRLKGRVLIVNSLQHIGEERPWYRWQVGHKSISGTGKCETLAEAQAAAEQCLAEVNRGRRARKSK